MKLPPLWDDYVEQRLRYEAWNIDPQEVPRNVEFCTRCVVSSARPRITFDEEGVCSACRYQETKNNGTINWEARGEELQHLLARHRNNSGHDIIVPTSGGKDSAMVAHRMKHEHRMNPLAVKWAPHIYTDIGFKNFNSFIQSGFDCQVGWPGGIIHRKLARIAMEFVGDPFLPFIYGQLAYPIHVANQTGIKLIMLGENGEAEYGGDTSANNKPSWSFEDWERIYLKSATVDRLLDIGLGLGCFTKDETHMASDWYRIPKTDAEVHWFSYYRKWHPQENYYYATEHTGFEANPDGRSTGTYSKYASIDDALDDPHYYFAYLKFGIGRATSDAAHEIRDGEIERDEAVALVKRYDGEYPAKCLPQFLPYVGCDEEHFNVVCERFTRKFPKVFEE